MKRIYIIAILITMCGLSAMAQDRPDLTHQTGGGDRNVFKFVNDQPTLIYDAGAMEIQVTGSESAFYNVEITSQTSTMLILQTVIDGEYDVIDASMLTTEGYVVALTSSQGNTFTWIFNNGQLLRGPNTQSISTRSSIGSIGINGLNQLNRE